MSLSSLLLSGLVVFATHALEAVTGFGCTVLALPFVTALLGLRTGVQVLTILAWVLALCISVTQRRRIDFRQFGIILGFTLAGMPLGMYLFRAAGAGALKRVLAAFIVASSAVQLAKPLAARRGRSEPTPACAPGWSYFLLLAAGGVVHGMFSSGGPFVVLYASRALPDKGAFRATLTLLWTALNTILIAGYLAEGSLTPEVGAATAAMLPFLAAGMVLGERLHRRASPEVFSRVVFSALLATGIILLFA